MKKVLLFAAGAVLFPVTFAAEDGAEENVAVVEDVSAQASNFDSVYGGLGIGGSFLKSDNKKFRENLDEKYNRFIGTVVLGAGKAFRGKYYVGAEFMMDFTKNKKKEIRVNDNNYAWAESNGVFPQLSLKLGGVLKGNNLVYLKVGGAWSKYKAGKKTNANNFESLDKSKVSWILGAGYERMFCKKFSVAVEPEYNFGFKAGDVKCNKGWNVRALVKYNVPYAR